MTKTVQPTECIHVKVCKLLDDGKNSCHNKFSDDTPLNCEYYAHFTDNPVSILIKTIAAGDLIESREALEHIFDRHTTCKSERIRCPLCREEVRAQEKQR